MASDAAAAGIAAPLGRTNRGPVLAFVLAFGQVAHEKGVAILFVLALVLLMAALVQFMREIRLALRTMHLE